MNAVQTVEKPVPKKAREVAPRDINKTKYAVLSKKEAIAMTSAIIEKYRPALEKLAE